MKKLTNNIWQSDSGEYFQEINTTYITACNRCVVRGTDDCIDDCLNVIGAGGYFEKITKEAAEKIMGKKKYIVKFAEHDENELVEAMCSDHARILAQAKRISMGETNVSIRSVEEIKPYVVKVDKYEITNNCGILSVTRNGEFWDRNLVGDKLVLALVQRIEKLETAKDNKNKSLENLLSEMKRDIKDFADVDIVSKLRELLSIPKGKQR